jgi:uncharacterized protein YegJ (DUF2314 family)
MTKEVFLSPFSDPEMDDASINARKSFKIFWRELSWEMRRIVPGLDASFVKHGFAVNKNKKTTLSFEQMWVGDISFDGQSLIGHLLNQPNEIEDLKQGDIVKFHHSEMSDWMYTISGKAYGAFTVNVIRSRMTKKELKDHDDAWGVDFGDPKKIYIEPSLPFDRFLQTPSVELPEHQMSENMKNKSEEGIQEMGKEINDFSFLGMTMLQFESLAGNLTQVKLLLKHGADKNIKNANGQNALDLAEMFGWAKISAILK